MKKVLIISPNGYIGGAEKFVIQMTKQHLQGNNWRPVVIFFNDGPAVQVCRDMGATTYLLKNKFKLSRPLQLWRACCELRKIIRDENPQVIHLTMAYAQIVNALACWGLNNHAKKVWYQHGPVESLLDRIAVLFPVEATLFNSHYLLRRHQRNPSLHESKYFVLAPGVELKANKTDSSGNLFETDKKVIATAGRFCFGKGMHLFVEAIALLKGNLSPAMFRQYRFAIIGSANSAADKIYEQAVKAQITQLGLADDLKLYPAQNPLLPWLQSMDCFVHCATIPEAYGLIIAEAMSTETFVIGTQAGGISELLIDHHTGISFNGMSENAAYDLATAITTMMTMAPGQRKKIVEMAKDLISNHHNAEVSISTLETIYQNLGA